MARAGTHDLVSADALVSDRLDAERPAHAKAQNVAEFYDLRPGEVIEPDAFRQARQMRGEWRRERYSRLSER